MWTEETEKVLLEHNEELQQIFNRWGTRAKKSQEGFI